MRNLTLANVGSKKDLQKLNGVALRVERYFRKHELTWSENGEDVYVSYNHPHSPAYALDDVDDKDKFEKYNSIKKSIEILIKDPGIKNIPQYLLHSFISRTIEGELIPIIKNLELILSRNKCRLWAWGCSVYVRFIIDLEVNDLLRLDINHRTKTGKN